MAKNREELVDMVEEDREEGFFDMEEDGEVELYLDEDDEEMVLVEDEDDEYVENDELANIDPLSFYAEKADYLLEREVFDLASLRQVLMDKYLAHFAQEKGISVEDLILGCTEQDQRYLSLLNKLYPKVSSYLTQSLRPDNREYLIRVLGVALSATVWEAIEKLALKKGITSEKLSSLAQERDLDPAYYRRVFNPSPFLASVVVEAEDFGVPPYLVVQENINLLDVLLGVEKEEKKEVSDSVDKKVLSEKVNEDLEVEVNNVVNAILKVYDNLYADSFVNRPLGVLTSQGILGYDLSKGNPYIVGGSTYAKQLYQFLRQQVPRVLPQETDMSLIDSSYIDTKGNLVKAYSPLYHLLNAYGVKADGTRVKTWSEFRSYLAEDLRNRVRNVLSKVPVEQSIKMQAQLISLFTNCILVDKFDIIRSMMLRIKIDGLNTHMLGAKLHSQAKELFGKEFGKVIHEGVDDFGVYDLLYVFDVDMYSSEILFSYKIYERLIQSGNEPSLANIVVGQGLDGKNVTINLQDEKNVLTGIIAASGSGKGVLTLNILASLYASGCPVMYLDYKPDMAATLWDVERYFRGKGIPARIFSIDSKEDRRDDGVIPVRKYPYGYRNEGVISVLSDVDYALFPYLKSLQFAALLATYRSTGLLPRNEKIFFILDETQGFTRSYLAMLGKLDKVLGGRKKDTESEEYQLAQKIRTAFGPELKTLLSDMRDVTGRKGYVSLILLAQKVDPAEWKDASGEATNWREAFAATLIASLNLKIIGKGAGTSPSYGLREVKKPGVELIEAKNTHGYWALSSTVKPTDATVEIFKSYLTLNKNDFDWDAYNRKDFKRMPYTGGVLMSINDDVIRDYVVRNEFHLPDGSLRESIGFLGLMKMLAGSDEAALARKMSQGYEQMELVFRKLGLADRYECVEEYLYDCSPQSIFSWAELKSMMERGLTAPAGVMVDKSDASVDWMGDHDERVPAGDVDDGVDMGQEEDMYDEGVYVEDNVEEILYSDKYAGSPYAGERVASAGEGQKRVPVDDDRVIKDVSSYKSPKDRIGYSNVYSEPIKLPVNPFQLFGVNDRPFSMINALKMMSNFLMDEIRRMFGDYQRIESVEITSTGLVFNDIAFRPKFSQQILDSLPYDIRLQVQQGNLVELFYFQNLYKFKNLAVLRIDNARLAEGRVRRELGLSPKKSWSVLFKKFPYLKEIEIGGRRITDESSAKSYDADGRGGFDLTEKLRSIFGVGINSVSSSRMERVWSSRPVKILVGAAGWTLGVKLVTLAASMFGPWGLLFGAFAGYGAYREFKKDRSNNKN